MGNILSSSYDYIDFRSNSKRLQTVKNLDSLRYSGNWYEIAKYPICWENNCERSSATYSYDAANKQIIVVNKCLVNDKVVYERRGVAWISNKQEPGKLKLRFVDDYPADTDKGEADYWIHWTDYDNYAIVGGPSGKYLWILSRKETISKCDIHKLLDLVCEFGYNPLNLMANPSVVLN